MTLHQYVLMSRSKRNGCAYTEYWSGKIWWTDDIQEAVLYGTAEQALSDLSAQYDRTCIVVPITSTRTLG